MKKLYQLLTDSEKRFIRGYEIFQSWDNDLDREIFEESYGPYWKEYQVLKERERNVSIETENNTILYSVVEVEDDTNIS